jgi:vancomycin permeability regulator SanA
MRKFTNKIIGFFEKNRRNIIQLIAFVSYIAALVFLFALIINLSIVAKTNDNIYNVDEIIKVSNDFDCILILGAGVKKDGSPTDMLYDRLMAGYVAFENKKSDVIFLSGDSEHSNYTETVTMKKVLNDKGVDDISIICDGYGLSTYESIWRAKHVYGYKKILIVTQKYHLHRAIYLSQQLGFEAYGLDGALRSYGKQPIFSFREYLARIKDMIYAELAPNPTYTHKWEVINE